MAGHLVTRKIPFWSCPIWVCSRNYAFSLCHWTVCCQWTFLESSTNLYSSDNVFSSKKQTSKFEEISANDIFFFLFIMFFLPKHANLHKFLQICAFLQKKKSNCHFFTSVRCNIITFPKKFSFFSQPMQDNYIAKKILNIFTFDVA